MFNGVEPPQKQKIIHPGRFRRPNFFKSKSNHMSKQKIIFQSRVIDYLVIVFKSRKTYIANIMSGDDVIKTITCPCPDECRDCAIRYVVNYL